MIIISVKKLWKDAWYEVYQFKLSNWLKKKKYYFMEKAKLMKNGYKILKKEISEETIDKIKKDLTYIPDINPNYKKT